jgi:hypothetical protein
MFYTNGRHYFSGRGVNPRAAVGRGGNSGAQHGEVTFHGLGILRETRVDWILQLDCTTVEKERPAENGGKESLSRVESGWEHEVLLNREWGPYPRRDRDRIE